MGILDAFCFKFLAECICNLMSIDNLRNLNAAEVMHVLHPIHCNAMYIKSKGFTIFNSKIHRKFLYIMQNYTTTIHYEK